MPGSLGRTLGLLAAWAALSAQQAVPAQDDDIVVIARKMRLVRLNYALSGPWLQRCEAERSSGDPRIDRIMCAMLRACISEGFREPRPAMACMNRRLDDLDGARVRLVEAAAPTPLPAPADAPAIIPQRQPSGKSDDVVVTARRELDDIVVRGQRSTMRGGLWCFSRSGAVGMGEASGSGGLPFRFDVCLPDGEIALTLRRLAGFQSNLPRPWRCGSLRTAINDGRITGSRACTGTGAAMAGIRANTTMSGRLTPRQMTVDLLHEEDRGLERGGLAAVLKRPPAFRWRVLANRVDACPLRRTLDQRSLDEAVDLLFDPRTPGKD